MKAFLLILLLIPYSSFACPLHDKMGVGATPAQFEYMIGIDDQTTSTVTEESFNRHFYNIFFLFHPQLQQFPLPVIPEPDWIKPYFSAYTVEVDGIVKMGFWGGMARISGMNDDGVALITCHEVGHILGGLPRFKIELYSSLSSEGQSDYYATSVCLKKYFSEEYSTLDELQKTQDPYILKICENRYPKDLERAICLRSLKGIQAFAQVMGHVQKAEGLPLLNARDSSIALETIYDQYPSHQCRIDTLIAGALGEDRPKCWYRSTL